MMHDQTNATPPPQTLARSRRGWRFALLFVILSLSAAAGWLLATSSGLQWLVSLSSGGAVILEGAYGTLLGPLGAKKLSFTSGDTRVTVRDIYLAWRPAALLEGRLEIATLTAQNVEILSPPSDDPLTLPQDLRLPLPLSMSKIDIAELRVIRRTGGAPDFAATRLSARLESDGRQHRLHDLRASLEFGDLSASARMDGIPPFALQAQGMLAGYGSPQARIAASASGKLEHFTLKAQGSGAGLSGQGEAQLQPFAAFPLAALALSVKGLDPHAFSPDAPQASIALQAELSWNVAGKLEGNVTAKNSAPAPLDRDGLPLLEAQARATISADSMQLDALNLILAGGGRISGHFAWQVKQATGAADLTISRLDPAALDTRLRPARLDGRATLSGDIQAQQGLIFLAAGALRLDASLARAGDILTLDSLRLARGRAVLTGQGRLGLDAGRPFAFKGELQHFDLSAFLQAPRSDLNARLEVAGALAPQANGTLHYTIGNSQLAGQPVSGSGQIGFSGMEQVKGEAGLRLGDNRFNARGGFGLPGERLEVDIAAPVLAQFGSGFGGALNAHATLAGSLSKLDMVFEMKGNRLSLPGDHHLASLSAGGRLHGEALNFKVAAAGYRKKSDLLVQNLALAVQGSRSRHELSMETLGNDMSLALHASGGLTDPAQGWRDVQWQGVLSTLTATGRIPFRMLAATPVTLGRERISLGKAEFSVAGGRAQLASAEWTPRNWSSRGSFSGIGLRPGGGSGEARDALRLAGEWDVSAAPSLAGKFRIWRESGDWILPGDPPIPLGMQDLQLDAQASDNRLTAALKAHGTRLGDGSANIALPLARSGSGWSVLPEAPLSGKVRIDVADLSWVGPALDDNIKSSGRLTLTADVTGTFGKPNLRGRISGDDLALVLLDQGIRLQQGRLAARLDQTRLHIEHLSFVAPHEAPPRDRLLAGLNLAKEPGSLTLSGMIDPRGKRGNLELSASRLPLAQRADRWIIASGQGRISFDQDMLTLGGKITADAGLLSQPAAGRPRLADDVVIAGRQTPDRQILRIAVDAVLDLGEQFYLRASGLEARLAGQLRLLGTPAQPLRASGSIATRDAIFRAYGQDLVVERGIVNFQGALDNPGLNVLALRKNLPVEAGVTVTGTMRRPVVRLVSTPNVPDPEKLSWIVLGRAPDADGTDASLLLAAAGSILGGQSGGLTGQLAQTLGVDELSLRQTQNGAPLTSQIITAGKRLSSRAFLSYEQGLTAVAGTIKLTYAMTPNVSIVTRAGYDNALDVLYTFHFD
jgi:translocation and assembly module TamB